jgi:rubrerythrin
MKIIQLAQNLQFVKTPENLDERETSRAIRDALVSEQLAIQQYEAIADGTSNAKVKEVLNDIADEERVHVGELLALLSALDPSEDKFIEDGVKEVEGPTEKTV